MRRNKKYKYLLLIQFFLFNCNNINRYSYLKNGLGDNVPGLRFRTNQDGFRYDENSFRSRPIISKIVNPVQPKNHEIVNDFHINNRKPKNYEYTDNLVFHSELKGTSLDTKFIKPKYLKFENEMKYNSICFVSEITFREQVEEISEFQNKKDTKRLKANFALGEVKKGDIITKDHLLAIIFYTNFDGLTYWLRKSLRDPQYFYKEENYFVHEYGNWGRLLWESTNIFGKDPISPKTVYHGLNKTFLFSKLQFNVAFTSTSTSRPIARLFMEDRKGMVITFKQKYERTLDVTLFSKYPNEEELLFGFRKLEITNMILDNQRNDLIPEILKGITYFFEGKISNKFLIYNTYFFESLYFILTEKKNKNLDGWKRLMYFQLEEMIKNYEYFIISRPIFQQIINIVKQYHGNIKILNGLVKKTTNKNEYEYGSKVVSYAKKTNKNIHYYDPKKSNIKNLPGRNILGIIFVEVENNLVLIILEYIIHGNYITILGHQFPSKEYLNIVSEFFINGESVSDINSCKHFFYHYQPLNKENVEIDLKYFLAYKKDKI